MCIYVPVLTRIEYPCSVHGTIYNNLFRPVYSRYMVFMYSVLFDQVLSPKEYRLTLVFITIPCLKFWAQQVQGIHLQCSVFTNLRSLQFTLGTVQGIHVYCTVYINLFRPVYRRYSIHVHGTVYNKLFRPVYNRYSQREQNIYQRGIYQKKVKRPFCCTVSILQVYTSNIYAI